MKVKDIETGKIYKLVEVNQKTCKRIALVIGHHAAECGAYSEFFHAKEYTFFSSELPVAGDVFVHNQFTRGYNNRQKEMAEKTKDFYLVIELHFNMFDGKTGGCQALTFPGNDLTAEIGARLTKKINARMGIRDRGTKYLHENENGYGFLKHQKPNAVLLECFFGDNELDCKKWNTDKFISIIHNLKELL